MKLSLRPRAPAPAGPGPAPDAGRILFPFVAVALSRHALDAALRIARVEEAVLLPVFLARVPRQLPLDAALPRQSGLAVASLEAIEQRAGGYGVAVDARVERGRTSRHALARAIDEVRYDRIVIAAAARHAPGFSPEDVAWLLAYAPGEILVLRAETDDALPELTAPSPAAPRRTAAIPVAYH